METLWHQTIHGNSMTHTHTQNPYNVIIQTFKCLCAFLYRTLFLAWTSFSFQQISGNCNTTILHTPEGFSYLYSYDCTLVPGKLHYHHKGFIYIHWRAEYFSLSALPFLSTSTNYLCGCQSDNSSIFQNHYHVTTSNWLFKQHCFDWLRPRSHEAETGKTVTV